MDSWQETAFSNRHVHNRVGRTGRRGGHSNSNDNRSGSGFDVKRIFGSYEVECPAAVKRSFSISSTTAAGGGGSKKGDGPSQLEIYRLNEARNAVVGEVKLEGVLAARVVLTGSRKVMKGVVEGMRRQRRRQRERDVEVEKKAKTEAEAGGEMGVAGEGHDENEEEQDVNGDDDDDENEQSEESEDGDEAAEKSRFDTFEKNSFRAPKFWLWWQGEQPEDRRDIDDIGNGSGTMKGTGYIVFTGNECKAFTGTISCDEYGWDNVKFSGRKVRARAERDFALQWMVDDDDKEEEEE